MNGEDIRRIAEELGELCAEKNASYGDSFKNSGKILEVLYPKGVSPEQYQDMLGIARVLDKLGRIANRKDAFGESPWKDIVGYAILGALLHEDSQEIWVGEL